MLIVVPLATPQRRETVGANRDRIEEGAMLSLMDGRIDDRCEARWSLARIRETFGKSNRTADRQLIRTTRQVDLRSEGHLLSYVHIGYVGYASQLGTSYRTRGRRKFRSVKATGRRCNRCPLIERNFLQLRSCIKAQQLKVHGST